jgi:hypothetical protein
MEEGADSRFLQVQSANLEPKNGKLDLQFLGVVVADDPEATLLVLVDTVEHLGANASWRYGFDRAWMTLDSASDRDRLLELEKQGVGSIRDVRLLAAGWAQIHDAFFVASVDGREILSFESCGGPGSPWEVAATPDLSEIVEQSLSANPRLRLDLPAS